MGNGNRVEELESRVKQLEASVSGLTDELVECKERLRALEAEVETDDIIEGTTTRSDAAGTESRTGGRNAPSDPAEGDAEAESEEAKPEQEKEEESAGSDDEIIVA